MYRVYVCCGPNCGPKGSRDLLDFLEAEVERLALQERVRVFPGGCQTHCETGPTMVVYPGPVFYEAIDRQRLQRIAHEHFVKGSPVAEYFWSGPPAYTSSAKKPLTMPAGVPSFKNDPSRDARQPKPKPRKTYEVDDFKW
jgi:NADP-reducing hydrogenase subunit HndC